nr:MAG TPA: hypothetical protein [Caudoviricetes sp.]
MQKLKIRKLCRKRKKKDFVAGHLASSLQQRSVQKEMECQFGQLQI